MTLSRLLVNVADAYWLNDVNRDKQLGHQQKQFDQKQNQISSILNPEDKQDQVQNYMEKYGKSNANYLDSASKGQIAAMGARLTGDNTSLMNLANNNRHLQQTGLNNLHNGAMEKYKIANQKQPNSIVEHEYGGGTKDDYFARQEKMKQLGASRTTNKIDVHNPASVLENAHDKKMGGHFADQGIQIIQSAEKSASMARGFENIVNLTKDSYTGSNGEFVQDLRKFGASLGMDGFSKSSSKAEQAEMISNKLMLQLRSTQGGEGMPGPLSDRDLSFLKKSIPGLLNTKEGLDYIAKVMRNKATLDLEVASFVQKQGGYTSKVAIEIIDKFGSKSILPEGNTPDDTQATEPENNADRAGLGVDEVWED